MFKKILLWTVVLLCIVIAIVSYVGYRSFNTEAFKQHIVDTMQELTGRNFYVNGSYSLTWDPLPTMTLKDVALANIENSETPNMFKASEIQIQIEWASLFSSPIRIKNIIIINPQIWIERISHSVTNIDFPLLFTSQADTPSENLLGERQTQALIDNIHIENGTLHYLNKMWKQELTIDNLTGEFVLSSLGGPFKFTGTGNMQGISGDITAYFSNLEKSKPLPFFVECQLSESGTHAKLEGNLYPENVEKYVTGSISFDIKKPNVLLKQLNLPSIPSIYDTNILANTEIAIKAKETILSNFILKTEDPEHPFAINASYSIENISKKGNLKLEVSTLNFSLWKDILYHALKEKFFSASALDFDINIAHFILESQEATTLNLIGVLNSDLIQVTRGSVLLPGSTTVQLSGRMDTDGSNGQAKLDAQSQVWSNALHFFKLPDIPLMKILQKHQKAEFSSEVKWHPNSIDVSIPAFSLDQTTGSCNYHKEENTPVNINLTLNNLNLDQYLEKTSTAPSSFKDIQRKIISFLKSPQNIPEGQIEVTAQNLSYNTLNFQKFHALIENLNNVLNLNIIAQEKQDSSIVFNSQIQNIGTESWHLEPSQFQIHLASLNEFLKAFNIQDERYKFATDSNTFNLTGEISGNAKQYAIDITHETKDYTLGLKGMVTDTQPQNMTLNLHHNSTPHFMMNIFNKNPFPFLQGDLTLEAKITQQDKTFHLSDIILSADNQQLSGQATYDSNTRKIDIDLTSSSLNLDKILPNLSWLSSNDSHFSDTPFNLDWLNSINGSMKVQAETISYHEQTLKDATVTVLAEPNKLQIENLYATAPNNQPSSYIQGKGSFEFNDTPTLTMDISTQSIPLPFSLELFNGKGLKNGLLSSELHLTGSGNSPKQLVNSLTGEGSVRLQNPTWIGMNLSNLLALLDNAATEDLNQIDFEQNLKNALSTGSTSIQSIEGNFQVKQGFWQMPNAQLKITEIDTQKLSIEWNISSDTIQAMIPFKVIQYADLPEITLEFFTDSQNSTYTPNLSAFVDVLFKQIQQEKQRKQAAQEEQARQEYLQELNNTKKQAMQRLKQLDNQLLIVQQQLEQTPNIQAQQSAQLTADLLKTLHMTMEKPESTLQDYQTVIEQAQVAEEHMNTAQDLLVDLALQTSRQETQNLLTKTNELIEKMDEMHKKRPYILLLSQLIQNSQSQRDIIQRSLAQFDKKLSYTQIQKVFDIVRSAHNKVKKAYDYSEELYAGRTESPKENGIKRVSP